MTTKNFVVKNGLTTGNIILDASSSNITANVVVANLSVPATANLGAVGNITITGGSANYVLSTDGAGSLSWVAQSAGSSYSNANVAAYLPTYTGNVSAGNVLTDNLLYANGTAWSFSNYSNTNVAAYLPTYTGNVSPANLTVSTSANLGNVSNITITGGSANYVLSTDGAGNLSWVAQTGGGSSGNAAYTFDSFSGNGVQTQFTLSTTPAANTVLVNYNGALQLSNAYSITGNVITMTEAPASGSQMEVVTLSGGGSGGGSVDASALLSPFLLMGA